MSVRVGIDTGGTHTDVVLVDGLGGQVLALKVPTTPHEREPWRVQADVRAGLVSLETAETVYGVRLDPGTLEIAAILRDTGDDGD